MARWRLGVLGGGWMLAMMAAAGAEQVDPATRGHELFENRCARCHGLGGDGSEGLAPALVGVVGRPAGARPDFSYSRALKTVGGTWTAERLDMYLTDPQAFAPGAEMELASPDPADRAAIIEYLKTLH